MEIPTKISASIPDERFYSIDEIISELEIMKICNFGKRTADPITRDVPSFWFDGYEIDPTGGSKNIVYTPEQPYACLCFHPDDLTACNPYAKELYFAGYNVRSCENCTEEERKAMLSSPDCFAYVPFITKRYCESGQIEKDFITYRDADKPLVALYLCQDATSVCPQQFPRNLYAFRDLLPTS